VIRNSRVHAEPKSRGTGASGSGYIACHILAGSLLLLVARVMFAASTSGDAILGRWLVEDGDAVVEIVRCANAYCGQITWLKEPRFVADDDGVSGRPKTDRNNPDADRRGDPILGSRILRELRFNGQSWERGWLYDPETGNTYHCSAVLTGADRLEIRGYLGISLLGRTAIWTRRKWTG
jgi:uncharacterized protein (DUF2147 family)